MKSYELSYLISFELSEEEARQFHEKIISLIQEEGGVLIEGKMPFKKGLAYTIKKQSQAYLAFIAFKLMPEKLASLEKNIKKENNILRYLVLIKPSAGKIREARFPKITKVEKPAKEKKVELKEIEQKLEEILDEPQ